MAIRCSRLRRFADGLAGYIPTLGRAADACAPIVRAGKTTVNDDQDKFKEPELVSSDDGTQARSPVGLMDSASAEPSPAKDLQPGEIVAQRYKVLHIIGKGAMGCVYRVEQLALQKELALKTLNPVAATDVNIRRFQNEALAAAKLEHPNLVRAVDYGWLGPQPYLVMDLVEGPTLAQHLKIVTTLSLESALQIFTPICFALAYAHEEGVIHRDLKPSNIVLSSSGDKRLPFLPKLVDFGIAKLDSEEGGLTKTGEVFGTPLYMSPEQCLGSKVDNRSDIYSLGCVLYEALTGAPPFRGQSVLETMMQHRVETQLPLKQAALGRDFPAALEKILQKMLAKEPSQRYQNCLEVAQDLTLLQQGRSDLVEKSTSAAAPVPNSKIMIGSAIVIAIVCCLVVLLHEWRQNQPAPRQPVETTPTNDTTPSIDTTQSTPNTDSMSDVTEQKFSRIIGKMREFDFGKQKMGVIAHMQGNFGETIDGVPAEKIVKFQKDFPLLLDVPFHLVYRDPHLLSRFRLDDLHGLKLNFSASDSLMDIQEQSVEGLLAFASRLKELRYLHLPPPITTRAFMNLHMEDLTQLETLLISRTEIDCAQLAPYRKTLCHLRMLDVSSLRNVPSLLKSLRGSTRMISLVLADDGLKDADMGDIAKITSLKRLQLAHNDITDAGIAKLTQLGLTDINLVKTHVTAACAKDLAKIRELNCVTFPKGLKKDEAEIKRAFPPGKSILFGD